MEGQFVKEAKDAAKPVNIIFSLNEEVGALAESLKIFKVTTWESSLCWIRNLSC